MSKTEHEMNSVEIPSVYDNAEHECATPHGSLPHSLIQHFRLQILLEQIRTARKAVKDSDVFSVCLLLLALPMLGMAIQIGLFLFGKTCSPFPMWFSFLVFSTLALLIHWKCLLKFWGLVFLALLFTFFTFSYLEVDAEHYHIPMQLLLRNGWNPVFDSSVEKFHDIVNSSTINIYHTLFLPKTVALCGALVARSTGLWIADSFLGYILLFVLLKTSFVFAKRQWNCHWSVCLLFSLALSLNSKLTLLMEGRIDYHMYSAMMTAILSLVLYLQHRRMHDFVLAILATAICGTIKSTGLVNCVFLWLLFGIYSWKRKETYGGILAVTLLVAWIGMSPLITSWIQYGSPVYPTMTFDPKIALVDITDDFLANVDGEKMGYLARFVYAWISPALAAKACALYYRQESFNPVFHVLGGVGGLKGLNCLLCFSFILLMLAKKDLVTFSCFFIVLTLVLCPLKYIGFSRYFPQVWAVIPMGIFQFIFNPPDWLREKGILLKLSRYSLIPLLCVLCCSSAANILAFQVRCMIREGIRQDLLTGFRKNDAVVVLPENSKRNYVLSERLLCGAIDHEFSKQTLDWNHIEDDSFFPYIKQYYMGFWQSDHDYPVCNSPSGLIHFKWLDLFQYFPHPLLYRKARVPESAE